MFGIIGMTTGWRAVKIGNIRMVQMATDGVWDRPRFSVFEDGKKLEPEEALLEFQKNDEAMRQSAVWHEDVGKKAE